MERRKVYVEVMVKISPIGEIRPLTITYENGKTYEIENLLKRSSIGSGKTEYKIIISKRETSLYEDNGRWFVRAKAS